MDAKDYINLFEQSSELLVVIDTDFIILNASDAYLKTTKTQKETIVGQYFFTVFPNNPNDTNSDGVSNIRASFNRVLENKISDTINVVKYDIPKPQAEGGGFMVKYWQPCHTPVLDAFNNVKYIIQCVKDVTENEELIAELKIEKTELKKVEDSEKRYNMLLMKSPFGVAVLKGKNMVITLANDSIKKLWGKGNDIEGKPLFTVISELKDSSFPLLLDEVYTTGKPFNGNELLAPLVRNGKLEDVYFNFVYQPYLEADESISGVTIIATEVTNEVIAKQKIKDSQQQLQNIFMQAPFALNIYEGKELVISLANKLFCEIIGKTESEILGKKLFDVFPETANQGLDKILSDIFSTGIPFKGNEFPVHFLKDGNEFKGYFDFIYQPIFDYNNNVSGVINVAIDVTDKVLARKKIEDSEKRYNLMLMKSPFGFAIFKGENMVITIANESIKEFWGKGNDVEGIPLFDLIPELRESDFPRLINDVYTTGIPFYGDELLAPIFRNGKLEDAYFNFVYQPYLEADESISGVTIIAYEVTEQVIAKRKIEESEERFRLLVMQAPVAIGVVRGEKYVVEIANAKILEFWGRTEAQVLNKPIFEVLTELEGQGFEELVDNVYTTGERFVASELPVTLLRNGQLENAYVTFVYEPLREVDGTISGIMVLAHEITDLVVARKKIEDSEVFNRTVLNASPDCIKILDAEGRLQFMNENGICLLEIDDFNLLKNKYWWDLWEEDNKQLIKEAVTKANTGQKVQFQAQRVTAKGTIKWWDIIVLPIKLKEPTDKSGSLICVSRDITEQVLAHQKVEESEEHFRLMADLMPSKISNASADGSVTYFNKHWLDFCGYTFEELRDFGYQQIMHPDEVEEFQQRLQKAAETGIDLVMEMRFKNKQGDYIWHLNIASPIKDKNGIHKMWIGVTTEIHEQKIVAEKIKASEERFRHLVMQAPVAICVLRGEDFIFETINQEMANFLDRKIEDSLHKPLFDVIAEVKDQVYKELLDDVYRTGTRFVSQELPIIIKRNGRLEDVFVKFVYEPLREPDGTISGVMALADEITDQVNARKAIEVSEKKFRLLTNNMPQKISNADADGNVLFFNQQWIDDTGLTFDELVDGGLEKAIHPDDLALTVNHWKHSVATGEIFDMECRIKNKEGGYRWHLSRAVPIKDETGKILMWVGSNTDIHELKEATNRAEEATNRAEEATNRAEEATVLAENATKAKQLFLSNMSHEIRTPMNAIIGFTSVVLKTDLSNHQKEYINAIKVSGDALIVLINDILDLSKVDAGKMTFQQAPFALAASIAATLHLFQLKIQEKNLELIEAYDAAIPEMLVGDSIRLRQIMLNLLSNAIKFTDVGKITVSVKLLKAEADTITIEFSVTDTGIGVAENKLDHIFGDFEQATYDTTRLYGGTGLGLSIVKQFVELQGGNIFVKSKLGEGSTFGFILNFKKADALNTEMAAIASADNAETMAESPQNVRILVAEDVPLNQLLIKIILNDFGFEVDIASNGAIAIEKLQANKYDIILMDLQMPELNGFEATAHIRSKLNAEIPIIALTADVTTVDVEKCNALGMQDYISKPVDENLLYTKIIKYTKKDIM